MSDALKDVGIALFGLAFFTGLLTGRAQHAAARDLHRALPGAPIQVTVESRGVFGMAVGQAYRVSITGSDFSAARLPFQLERGGGILASARHLELDLHNIVLADLPVQSLRADVPFVKVDGVRALFSGHLTLREAQAGTGVAVLTPEGLAAFLSKKRPELQNIRVRLTRGEATVAARTSIFVGLTDVEARAKVAIADGRYLNAVNATVMMNGKPLAPALAERLLGSLNPIIDVERDLRLSDWLYVTDAEIGDGTLTVRARVTIPRKEGR